MKSRLTERNTNINPLLVVSSNSRFFRMKPAIVKNHKWLNPLSVMNILNLSSARMDKK